MLANPEVLLRALRTFGRLVACSAVAVFEVALSISLGIVPDAAGVTGSHRRSRSTLPSSTSASPGLVYRRGSGKPRR